MRVNSPTTLEDAWCVMKGYGLLAPIGGVLIGWSIGVVAVRRTTTRKKTDKEAALYGCQAKEFGLIWQAPGSLPGFH